VPIPAAASSRTNTQLGIPSDGSPRCLPVFSGSAFAGVVVGALPLVGFERDLDVGGHPDLPAGGHEEDTMAITERDRIR
jgi:hypothetical protein